ncbi:MAG TPA: murein biosynthesis integral membrane protein MurJ [Nitrospiria bacterium]|nr:murein biosynthesis integral membrane protein MurJ [Nitrospiria bacterium]
MTQERHQIAKAAGLISAATFSSRILGFIRDMILARFFGATMVSDAFFVAYRIPNMLRELFAEGSMSAAFIPVFTETLTKQGKAEARRLASAMFTVLLILVSLVTAVAIILAPWIVRAIAPGFFDELGKYNLTVMLSRFMFPYLLFVSLGALLMGMLNSLRSFATPAFSPVLFNVMIISSALFLAPNLTEPIFGVAIGVTLGGLAQFVVQIPSLKRKGMLPSLSLDFSHPGVRRIGWLIIPSIIGLSVTQVNILVNTILASFLPEGSQTYLFYGMRLVLFPLGVFGIAIGTAILPTMARQISGGEMDEMKKTLSFGLRLVFFIIVPSMAGLMTLRVPIIHLFFEHGVFTAAATAGTAGALLFYSVGLPAFAGIRIVAAAFYSMQDTRTPVKVAVLAMATNVVLCLILMKPMKHEGLALATGLSAVLNFSLLVWILNRKLKGIDWPAITRSIGTTIGATIPVALIGWGISQAGIWSDPGDWAAKAVWLFGGIAAAVLAYMLAHRILKSEEQTFLWDMVKRKIQAKGIEPR